MGNSSEFQKAVKLVINTVSFDKDSTVQVFEATIRYIVHEMEGGSPLWGGSPGHGVTGRVRVDLVAVPLHSRIYQNWNICHVRVITFWTEQKDTLTL